MTLVKTDDGYQYTATIREAIPENKLFVYGIFLGENMRNSYGMTNPVYATVPGYATFGHHIVQATHLEGSEEMNLELTGLLVDVDPTHWAQIDSLEAGYDRAVITTSRNEKAYIYVSKESK